MEFKIVKTIHLAFCLVVITFSAVSYLLVGSQVYFSTQLGSVSPYFLLFPLAGLIGISIGGFLYNKFIERGKDAPKFERKIALYKTGFLIKAGLIELGAVLNLVAFLVSSNLIFMAFAGISLLSLISIRPLKAKILEDLNVAAEDVDKL